MLKITNSLTPDLGPQPLAKKLGQTITMYSCGPTVYDHAHIGNLRSFISDDLLRRTIAEVYGRDHLKAIMNITDIDDKMITRSREKYPELAASDPNAALHKLADVYTEAFMRDIAAVGVDTSLFTLVRATDQIPAMQDMIRQISDNGLAYISEGSVYFDLSRYRESHVYGLLAHVDFTSQRSRVDNDEYDKDQAQDFVLWKTHKVGEPSWDFEFVGVDSDGQVAIGNLPGRPGWHIECSAMSMALGVPFDIHTGGIDLKFPHHENEIAQTMAATGKPMARVFVHYNHLFVDGRKMSKSLGNFYTLPQIEDRGYSPLAFRMLCLQAHYASELNFTWESLEAAQNLLLRFNAWSDLQFQDILESDNHVDETYAPVISKVNQELQVNLQTWIGLGWILGAVNAAEQHGHKKHELIRLLIVLDSILGLHLSDHVDLERGTKELIYSRQIAKDTKDFATADLLRDELAAQYIEIDDTPNGSRWRRTQI